MMWLNLLFLYLGTVYLANLRTAQADDSNHTILSCPSSTDRQFKGSVLQCTGMNIESITSLKLPANVTTLILDNNSIHTIHNFSFHFCSSLKVLSIRQNGLLHIELFAFEGLNHLEVLKLGDNNLITTGTPWSDGLFQNLSHLRVLELGGNSNGQEGGVFPEKLFLGLVKLVSLSLETFTGDLQFNDAMSSLTKLQDFTITGEITQIKNDTFSMFETVPLETLDFHDMETLVKIETNAFQHLKYLRSFTFRSTTLGVTKTLESFHAFQHRNMTNVFLESISLSQFVPNGQLLIDGILDVYKTRYLSQICIENFALTHSGVYVIEKDVLSGASWRSCLKTLDLSGNPLVGDRLSIMEMAMMHSLQNLHISDLKEPSSFVAKYYKNRLRKDHKRWYACSSDSNDYTSQKKVGVYFLSPQNNSLGENQLKSLGNETATLDNANGPTQVKLVSSGFHRRYGRINDSRIQRLPPYLVNNVETSGETVSSHSGRNDDSALELIAGDDSNSGNMPETWKKSKFLGKRYIILWIPETLEVLHAESMAKNFGHMDNHVLFKGAHNLRELYWSDNGMHHFVGVYKGFHNLKVFDISFNDCSVISLTFFDVFPSLELMYMKRTMLDSQMMQEHSNRLFQQLIHLRHLDLSDNSLNMLAAGTFHTSTDLRTLILSNNRFNSIPIDLENMPHLCYLDLRWNSIIHFTDEEMNSLDDHAMEVPGFSLLLEGNVLSCDCSHLKFLHWLQQTHVQLDKQGNYSCFTESGELSSTYTRADIQGLWRQCVGKTYFLSSVALSITMVLAFVLCILFTRYKTHLLSIFLQMFSPQFVLHKPYHYPIGVFISYSDQDTLFACHFLRRFVEDKLGMSTYLRDRDLLPASDIAESIVETINSSWRVLLVISEEYLYNDDWAYFTMKTVAYTVSPRNPCLLVVLVEERIKHKLPRCLLRAVDEKNIVSVTRQGQMNYDERQKLKMALVH